MISSPARARSMSCVSFVLAARMLTISVIVRSPYL
jgi:hypothetical protein